MVDRPKDGIPTNRTLAEAYSQALEAHAKGIQNGMLVHAQVIGQHIDLAVTTLSLVAMTPHMLLPRQVVVVGLGTLCVRGGAQSVRLSVRLL